MILHSSGWYYCNDVVYSNDQNYMFFSLSEIKYDTKSKNGKRFSNWYKLCMNKPPYFCFQNDKEKTLKKKSLFRIISSCFIDGSMDK